MDTIEAELRDFLDWFIQAQVGQQFTSPRYQQAFMLQRELAHRTASAEHPRYPVNGVMLNPDQVRFGSVSASAKADAQARGDEAVAFVRESELRRFQQQASELTVEWSLPVSKRAEGTIPLYTQPAPALAREPLSRRQMDELTAKAGTADALIRAVERHFGITADSARAVASVLPEAKGETP